MLPVAMPRADTRFVEPIETLDADDGRADDLEAAWEAEIDRRVEEIESGEDEGVPAEEVFARFGLVF